VGRLLGHTGCVRLPTVKTLTPVEVVLVGSCRVGFTLLDKPDRPRYSPLHSGSDLDIAVVSARLFDQLWYDVFVYSKTDLAFAASEECRLFRLSLFGGWIEAARPPSGASVRA